MTNYNNGRKSGACDSIRESAKLCTSPALPPRLGSTNYAVNFSAQWNLLKTWEWLFLRTSTVMNRFVQWLRRLTLCSSSSREIFITPHVTPEHSLHTYLVRPRIKYSAAVWDPHTQKYKDIPERVNRRAARVVYKKSFWDKEVSPTKLIQELGWKTLETRREHQRLSMMYKISNHLVAIPPTQLISPARTLRGHSKKFKTIRTTCDTVKYSFFQEQYLSGINFLETLLVHHPLIASRAGSQDYRHP